MTIFDKVIEENHETAEFAILHLLGEPLLHPQLPDMIARCREAGIKTVIVPEKNSKDLVDVPRKVQREVTIVFADTMDTVLETALVVPKKKRKVKGKKPTG